MSHSKSDQEISYLSRFSNQGSSNVNQLMILKLLVLSDGSFMTTMEVLKPCSTVIGNFIDGLVSIVLYLIVPANPRSFCSRKGPFYL